MRVVFPKALGAVSSTILLGSLKRHLINKVLSTKVIVSLISANSWLDSSHSDFCESYKQKKLELVTKSLSIAVIK